MKPYKKAAASLLMLLAAACQRNELDVRNSSVNHYMIRSTASSSVAQKSYITTESDPIIKEGNLSQIYSSRTKSLPEILRAEAFNVKSDQSAQIYNDDYKLVSGTSTALSELGDLADAYIIVNAGHAHLPGIADYLLNHNMDCSFVIPGRINERFHETIKYWAKEYKKQKEKSGDSVKGYATLIDCHREYQLEGPHFPTAEKLQGLGIKRVILFQESSVGKIEKLPEISDLTPIFCDYQKAGLEIYAYGIDLRQGSRNSSNEKGID